MNVLLPMEGVNITVLIQWVATIVHVLILQGIHLILMVVIALVSTYSNSTTVIFMLFYILTNDLTIRGIFLFVDSGNGLTK